MPCVEPKVVMKKEVDTVAYSWPKQKGRSQAQLEMMFRKWSEAGRLKLFWANQLEHQVVQVVNAYKDESKDRRKRP